MLVKKKISCLIHDVMVRETNIKIIITLGSRVTYPKQENYVSAHEVLSNGRTLNNMKRALDKCQNKCMEALNVYMLSPESMLLFSSSLIYVT